MREIHLFAGIGGGIYGGILLGNKCVGAIEIDEFCCQVLKQRQDDGWMEKFPIKNDLTKISGESYKNTFDILCGGFPCQAFSTAARGRNIQEKDLWKEMFRFVKQSEAPIVFGENVTRKAIEFAEKDLLKVGYKIVIIMLSNSLLGANHQRNRFWLLGVKKGEEERLYALHSKLQKEPLLSGHFWSYDIHGCGTPLSPKERRKQLKGLGNAQSPIVAATAFRLLVNKLVKILKGPLLQKNRLNSLAPSKRELSEVFKPKKSWIYEKHGSDFGFIHTPTTMANYSAPSMMKHKGCRNFVEVFNQPNPDNAEWLMGFPINASSPCKLKKNNFDIWKSFAKKCE